MCREELRKPQGGIVRWGKSFQLTPSAGLDGGAGEQLAQGPGPCQAQTPQMVVLLQREEQRAELS